MIFIENMYWIYAIPVAFVVLLFLVNLNFTKVPDEKKKLRWKVFILRFLVITLLLIGLAAPYTATITTEQGSTAVKVLADRSASMDFYENQEEELLSVLEQTDGSQVFTIAEGLQSPIGTGLLNTLFGEDNILLISDGNVNEGKSLSDVLSFASVMNATVNILELEPAKKEAAITIEGSKDVLSGVPASFSVDVSTTEDVPYTARVLLNGQEVRTFSGTSTNTFPFTLTLQEGTYRLEALLDTNDARAENNRYYKSVRSLAKPRILLLSQRTTPLLSFLQDLYTVDMQAVVPNNLDSYMAVVLGDMPASAVNNERLASYISQGNGVVVMGGQHSYEKGGYDSSPLEALLPARIGSVVPENITDLNVVLVLDISVSSGVGTGGGKVVDVEKAQAINIFNQLNPKDKLGVIAFNNEAHLIADLKPVEDQVVVPNRISQLQDTGGTYLETGLIAAAEMLQGAVGNKQVIVISDGKTKNPDYVKNLAAGLRKNGVSIHTVGVGEKSDAEYLAEVAEKGGGTYFQSGSEQRLNLVLGEARGDESPNKKLIVMNSQHFITKNINATGTISGYNQVVPKPNAQLLVSTEQGIPIITAWRYGLGRVVSVATDSGEQWGGTLLNKDSKLLSRSINWALGDPRRKQSTRVYVEDGFVEESLDVYIIAQNMPSVQDLTLQEVDTNLYKGSLIPERTGFFTLLNEPFAVNPPEEYTKVGINPRLRQLVSVTGGEVVSLDNADALLEKIRKDSEKQKEDKYYFREFLLGGAILLLLLEIYLRRKQKN